MQNLLSKIKTLNVRSLITQMVSLFNSILNFKVHDDKKVSLTTIASKIRTYCLHELRHSKVVPYPVDLSFTVVLLKAFERERKLYSMNFGKPSSSNKDTNVF